MVRGRPRAFDKEAALEIALRLFWEHGYEGTSIAMLANAINIKIPSLYAAFGNKEQLFLQAIGRYGELCKGIYQDSFEKKTAYDVTKSILEEEINLVTHPNWPNGCLMMQGALATSPESESIRKTVADMRRMGEDQIRIRFEQAQQEGYLPTDANPAAMACYVMTILAGLAVQAKSGASREQLQDVVQLAMQNWPYAR
jgi:AcrR family transcriptional regulator